MGVRFSSKLKQREMDELDSPVPIKVLILDSSTVPLASSSSSTLNLSELKLGPFYDLDIANKHYAYYDSRFVKLSQKVLSGKEFEMSTDSIAMTVMKNPKLLSEMFSIVKRKGIKQKYRWYVWSNLANYDGNAPKEVLSTKVYHECLKKKLGTDGDTILKDSMRTFRDHRMFRDSEGIGMRILERICQGLAAYFPKVGYVQGMNYVVGFLLEVSGFDEFGTWLFLIDLFKKKKNLYFGLYEPNFPLVEFKMFAFDFLLRKTKPRLASDLAKLEMPNEMWIFKWFVTMYASILEKEYLLRVWDFLVVGDVFSSVYVALVIIRFLKKLIKEGNMMNFIETVNDSKKLCGHFDMYRFFKMLKDYKYDLKFKLGIVEAFQKEARRKNIDAEYICTTFKEHFGDENSALDFGYVADYQTIELFQDEEEMILENSL